MTTKVFGHIPEYPEGTIFETRSELSRAGVHRPLQAGISGRADEGADSVVLSGGYEDDQDFGDIIIYTGHGGRDPESRQQIGDQLLTRGNRALAYSCQHGLPVRIIRGSSHRSPYSPTFGYRYDGLYRVEDYWRDIGKSGYAIWRYRLTKLRDDSATQPQIAEQGEDYKVSPKQTTTIQRVVRDTKQGQQIKALYDYCCQVCNTRLEGSAGPYAEAAHIRPLGAPHNGPDVLDNILCLCPNHHVLFDYGGFAIADDFSLLGVEGKLIVKAEHRINLAHIQYHREHYFNSI